MATTIGNSAPGQETMTSAVTDIFPPNLKTLFIKQEMSVIELFGVEAKQKYRVSDGANGAEQNAVFLYISEESNCAERICCGPNRSLTMKVHQGNSKEGPVIQTMEKNFSFGCCIRPHFDVYDAGRNKIGSIDDPCRCCLMDQQVLGANGSTMFTTVGGICQMGVFCPLCADVDFEIKKNDQKVGGITKKSLTLQDACAKTNRFSVDFGSLTDAAEKRMALASAMLLDLEYFEQQK
mmetsp:Transcript_99111/g.303019  ORF Transcript_99111/g.303019 Transcript_99111/m.303019 type:complete len:236 (-) Transcript_99111:99-806(-)